MVEDEELLVSLLNSAPTVGGVATEMLDGGESRAFAERFGGTGSEGELLALRRMRDALQAVIHASADATSELDDLLGRAVLLPSVTVGGIHWGLQAPADEELAVRAALAWSRVVTELPGRLRPCANDECTLFLVDHSRPGTARWCSMATCGNRMKARTHARRQRTA